MTTGPEYFTAAQKALAKAEGHALILSKDLKVLFDQQLRLAEANMKMARLALDAAKAVAGGHLIEGFDLGDDGEDVDPLTRNANAWTAAVTEGGA